GVETTPAMARAWATDRATSQAPAAAPANMIATEATRRDQRGPSPPAAGESAASPVIVIVSTVVVRSGTASLRTTALRMPMAKPVKPITAYSRVGTTDRSDPAPNATPVAAKSNAASSPRAADVGRSTDPAPMGAPIRPPIAAPTKKARSAAPDRTSDSSGAPAAAKPRNTT